MEYELLFLRLGRTTEGLLVVGGLLVELKEALLIFPPDILYICMLALHFPPMYFICTYAYYIPARMSCCL
jgi:hypothetical protein